MDSTKEDFIQSLIDFSKSLPEGFVDKVRINTSCFSDVELALLSKDYNLMTTEAGPMKITIINLTDKVELIQDYK